MEDFLAWAVKVPVEIAVEVASSSLLFSSFALYSFSSKCVQDYALHLLQLLQQKCPLRQQPAASMERISIALLLIRKYNIC